MEVFGFLLEVVVGVVSDIVLASFSKERARQLGLDKK